MAKYHHKESDLQIRCVHWFRVTYPAFARLLEHPKNEGNGHTSADRRGQAIAKAEGVQAGVADLILHVPSKVHEYHGVHQEEGCPVSSLAIEMKTKTGRQSPEQKLFQRFFEAAGGMYIIIRSFEDFTEHVSRYMNDVDWLVRGNIEELYEQIQQEATDAARRELQRIINK